MDGFDWTGLASGLIGVLLGAGLTYWTSIRIDEVKTRRLNDRLHLLLVPEL